MLFSKRAKIEQINRAQLETFMKDKSEKKDNTSMFVRRWSLRQTR